jgi:hypothetical protein
LISIVIYRIYQCGRRLYPWSPLGLKRRLTLFPAES